MPCAAPCNRLPCDERCDKQLSCGHQCPGLCGETCPEGYCQACDQRSDARVDLLEFKEYRDIDLDETPIVVLSCAHFFTAESLDGLSHMSAVYTQDATGVWAGLRVSPSSVAVPLCPDCKQPIRQFATQRYNRVINRAVMDEISLKFFVTGKSKLQELQEEVKSVEEDLRTSLGNGDLPQPVGARKKTTGHYVECDKLEAKIIKFCTKMRAEHQPSKKLSDAIIQTTRKRKGDQDRPSKAMLWEEPITSVDSQVFLGGRLARLQLQEIRLRDQYSLFMKTAPGPSGSEWLSRPDARATKFLKDCASLVADTSAAKLLGMTVQASIAYARICKCLELSSSRCGEVTEETTRYVGRARELLHGAKDICKSLEFDGAATLLVAVLETLPLFEDRYEPITPEELASIKSAMVSGPDGIRTHSGHWYKCSNGHAVSFLTFPQPTGPCS